MFTIKACGTRGSFPRSEEKYRKYGGHTSCFYVDTALAYKELYDASLTGIVNLTLDPDGMIRHAVLNYEGEDGQSPSFALQVARLYAENAGVELKTGKDDDRYLMYTYPTGGYREGISFIDVLEDKYPSSYFADKIVLVGACASTMQDEYLTAISHGKAMYGVEVHANVIESLLQDKVYSEVNDNIQRFIMALIMLAEIAVFSYCRLRGILSGWLTAFIGWIGLCLLGSYSKVLFHVLWIPFGLTVLFIAAIGGRFVAEYASRKKLRDQFERYVDPTILKKILDSGNEELKLEGKQALIAVLFVDICGFTSLSEKLEPEEVVKILNKYLEMVTECIMRYEGTLDKFIGDCAMAFWNAPFEQDEPVQLALKAAIDMIKGAERLNDDLGFDLGFAIGIHCGKAVIGNIGSYKRMDFTAIGDTVNTASRLEGLKITGHQREGQIYISEDVKDVLQDKYAYIDLGRQPLKGKQEAFQVYAIDLSDEVKENGQE